MNIAHMWRWVLGFALLLVAFALIAPPGPYTDNGRPNHGGTSQIQQTAPAINAIRQEAVESPFYKQPCRDAPEDRQSDLCAQWRSVDWTKWGTLVAIVGTIGLWIQIYFTQQAVKDTGQATDEMRKANKIAERMGAAQVRAYISITPLRFVFVDGNAFELKFDYINSGQSPARFVNFWFEISHEEMMPLLPQGTRSPIGDIPAGASKEKEAHLGVLPDLQGMLGQPLNLYVSIVARYQDVFGVHREDRMSFFSPFEPGDAELPVVLFPVQSVPPE